MTGSPTPDLEQPRALDPADAALAAALDGHAGNAGATLSRDEIAEMSGIHVAVLDALAREGLLVPASGAGDDARYRADDAGVVKSGLKLLEAGLPLGELLDLARQSDAALRQVADKAIDVFLDFVRDPVHLEVDPDEAGDALVNAFEQMLPATKELIASHFGRLLLEQARARLDRELGETDPAGA